MQFSLDNYCYAAWRKGEEWNEAKFISHLEKVKKSGRTPDWVICPDCVGDSAISLQKWYTWEELLRTYGWKIAFAVQDGQEISTVPKSADVIFVGGSTDWKRHTIGQWCANFPRVHVGRVNTYRWLWYCHYAGAESIDGTGWYWQNKPEYGHLLDYLAITEGDQEKETGALFPIHEFSIKPSMSLARSKVK
jgi:hypothetical protein